MFNFGNLTKLMPTLSTDIISQNYDCIYQGHFGTGKKHFIGPKVPIKCRFCNLSVPEVTFRNQAHAIPELLGNRQLIVTDECDSCNSFFATALEDHLGKRLKPFRTLGMVKGKNGHPSYLSPDKNVRIDVKSPVEFAFYHSQDSAFMVNNEEKKEISINLNIERHIPCAAYKALVKIALSLMPNSYLTDFSDSLLWIRQSNHQHMLVSPLIVYASFVPGFAPFSKTSVLLLRKNVGNVKTELPNCQLILNFGNLQLQLIIPTRLDSPSQSHMSEFQFCFPRIKTGFELNWPFGQVQYLDWDLSDNEAVEPQDTPIKIYYQKMEDILPSELNARD